jgi:DNA-binding FrmR family transcriptional regulator
LNNNDEKKSIINRIKTVKGHLDGIENMINEQRSCEEILVQISAIKSSVNRIGTAILENYAKECLKKGDSSSIDIDDYEKVVDILLQYAKK